MHPSNRKSAQERSPRPVGLECRPRARRTQIAVALWIAIASTGCAHGLSTLVRHIRDPKESHKESILKTVLEHVRFTRSSRATDTPPPHDEARAPTQDQKETRPCSDDDDSMHQNAEAPNGDEL